MLLRVAQICLIADFDEVKRGHRLARIVVVEIAAKMGAATDTVQLIIAYDHTIAVVIFKIDLSVAHDPVESHLKNGLWRSCG